VFCGGLDFSKARLRLSSTTRSIPTSRWWWGVSLTGFALDRWPGPPGPSRAITSPLEADRPYDGGPAAGVPRPPQEWRKSDLAYTRCRWPWQIASPQTRWRDRGDRGSPAANDARQGPHPPGPGRSDRRAGDPLGPRCRTKPRVTKKAGDHRCSAFAARQGNVAPRLTSMFFGSIHRVARGNEAPGLTRAETMPRDSKH